MRFLLFVALLAAVARGAPNDYFAVRVVDADTGRGVPLVELTTTFKQRYVTDSAGYVAFLEPGLMTGDDVWFGVQSYGYEAPDAAFGFKGVQFKPKPGGSAEIKLEREQLAERLYRTTGYGVYRDSVLLGKRPPTKQPLLNARVTGQDTVQTALYKGKYYWMWQDTDRAAFPLGGFSMTGATTALPARLDPDKGLDFDYLVDKPGEFARPAADVPREGNHPLWLDGFTVVKDDRGQERLLARYASVNADMSPHEVGLCLFNDERQTFERFVKFDQLRGTLAPNGKPYRAKDGGVEYVGFTDYVRVRADFASASDPAKYEAFTPVGPEGQVERRPDGRPDWRWRQGAPRPDVEKLLKDGALKPDEAPYQMRDAAGKPVKYASGSIAWNAHLKRWTLVFGEAQGASLLGEVWLSTARSPEGPWRDAVKLATHARAGGEGYDLYNVIQHPELQKADGRVIYFEGTFVNTFGGPKVPTPYYNYNNLMYRVDVSDESARLPEPPPAWGTMVP